MNSEKIWFIHNVYNENAFGKIENGFQICCPEIMVYWMGPLREKLSRKSYLSYKKPETFSVVSVRKLLTYSQSSEKKTKKLNGFI